MEKFDALLSVAQYVGSIVLATLCTIMVVAQIIMGVRQTGGLQWWMVIMFTLIPLTYALVYLARKELYNH